MADLELGDLVEAAMRAENTGTTVQRRMAIADRNPAPRFMLWFLGYDTDGRAARMVRIP
jgi:hypothetical protein